MRFTVLILALSAAACTMVHKKTPISRGIANMQAGGDVQNKIALVNVLDTDLLDKIDRSGYSLNETLFGKKALTSVDQLYAQNSFYKSIVDVIGKPLPHTESFDQLLKDIPPNSGDIPEMVKTLRGVTDVGGPYRPAYKITQVSNDSHNPYKVVRDGDEPRHFDYRWLSSKFASFPLIAVVNRMDKRDQYPESCGEVRFIYRLSYSVEQAASSMPFLLNVVYSYPKTHDNCRSIAESWVIDKELLGKSESFDSIVSALENIDFKQVELNFQSIRFTSGYMHDFGGQAMYIQRVFKINEESGVAFSIPLENTPDVARVSQSQPLKEKLVNYIRENLLAIDQGVININFNNQKDNEEILAKRSISWSTLGRARSVNKPFRTLFKLPEDRALLPTNEELAALKFVKNRDGLLERLDNRTCVGCHQSGGTAGFHMLGLPKESFSHHFNRQQLPLSAHAFAEVSRRAEYVKALAEGNTPNTFRPHSVFPKAKSWSGEGIPEFENVKTRDLCLLQEKGAFSKAPTCASVFGNKSTCVRTVSVNDKHITTLLGECVEEKTSLAGSVCYTASINESSLKDANSDFLAFKDNLRGLKKIQQCGTPKGGAPLGRRSKKCTANQEKFSRFQSNAIPGELCANRGGNGFDVCAASGDAGQCLQDRVARSMLDTCNPGHFCREDYICQAFPKYQNIADKHYRKLRRGARVNLANLNSRDKEHIGQVVTSLRNESQTGFCVPTYFLFNMRTDGHPNPVSGRADGFPKINPKLPMRGI